jgi:hypothetical protein
MIESTQLCIWSFSEETHLSVFVVLLVIEVSLETEFGSTDTTLEASSVEEGKVLQRTHFVNLVDSVSASEATIFIGSRTQSFTLSHKLSS